MSKYLIFKTVFEDIFGSYYIQVKNKKSGISLGEIVFYDTWNQFVFGPNSRAVFNNECLMDIVKEINRLNKEKAKKDKR